MKIQISTIKHGAEDQHLFDLKEWIQDEKIKGVSINTLNLPTGSDKMGIEPDTLVAILGSITAGFELLSSMLNWIKSRKEETKIKITVNGKEVELSTSALSDENESIKSILHLLESAPNEVKNDFN